MVSGENITNGPAGSRTESSAPWRAPSVVERELHEASSQGDWSAFFDVLAGADLFVADSADRLRSDPGTIQCTPYWYSTVRANCLPLLTEGMLPPPGQDTVFERASLGWLADTWQNRGDSSWVVINPGSPCEVFFPVTRHHRALWREHVERVNKDRGPSHHRLRLRALEVGGVTSGPVAHGLALAALMMVNNGELWNTVAYHGDGYSDQKNRLEEWWGITSPEGWRESEERLLTADMVGGTAGDFVLGVRRTLARDFGGRVEVTHWRQAAERVVRQDAEDDAVASARVAEVRRIIGRIVRYEERFRADGVLESEKSITSVEAWDHGRAAAMARWGVAARYCDQQEAERALVRAGRVSRIAYRSWEDFAAAFILGRCLHFDEEEFGHWYTDMYEAHRILITDPKSPWKTVPWA